MSGGRPRRPPPDKATIRRLQRLYESKQRAVADAELATAELYLAAVEACDDEGATREQIAVALGVGETTVQGWVERGRVLRGVDG